MIQRGKTYHETTIHCPGPCQNSFQIKIGLRYKPGQRPKRDDKTLTIDANETLRDIRKLIAENAVS